MYLGWMLLYYIDSKSKTHPLMQNMMAFFILISPLVLIDSGVDILIFGAVHPVEVTCCSNAVDVGAQPVPPAIGGLSGQVQLLIILYVMAGVFAFLLFMAIKNRKVIWGALALSLPLAGIYVLNMMQVLCPWLLHLPFHHCPFCLLQDHPLSIVYTLMIWFGIGAPWLALITSKIGHETLETEETESKVRNMILKIAAMTILLSLIIIAVDVLVSFS
jgi:hypothetical protein